MASCSICSSKQIIYYDDEKTPFCKPHFIEYVDNKVKSTIIKNNLIKGGDKVAIAVSGGKDSTLLLYILKKFSEKIGFELVTISIDLGIKNNSQIRKDFLKKLCKRLDVPLYISSLKTEYGFTLDEIAKKIETPKVCVYCSEIRKHLLFLMGNELDATKIAIGYTLDNMFTIILNSIMRSDFFKMAQFISPIYPMKSLIKNFDYKYPFQITPLREVHEKEIILYEKLEKVPVVKLKPLCVYPKEGEKGSHGWWRTVITNVMDSLEEANPTIKYSTLHNFSTNFFKLLDIAIENSEQLPPIKCAICENPMNDNKYLLGSVLCEKCLYKAGVKYSDKIKEITRLA